MISVRLASQVSICGKDLNVAIFSDTVSMINGKLFMIVVVIELFQFSPFSVTLILFQGHSSVRQF